MRQAGNVNRVAWRMTETMLVVALGTSAWLAMAQEPADPTVDQPVLDKPVAGKSEYARRISSRNPFGLVDPPKPVEPPVVLPPPAPTPVSTVQLTGFSRWAGERKVYLVVTKQGAKTPDYFDLREGDERADIKVLQIDEQNETARISNAGVEQSLNFKDNGTKPGPGGGGVPGVPNPAVVGQGVPPPPISAGNRFGGAGPTVVGRGGVVENVNPTQVPQVFPNTGAQRAQFDSGGTGVTLGTQEMPVSTGQNAAPNPTLNRSRIFNIPPPPLPPVQ